MVKEVVPETGTFLHHSSSFLACMSGYFFLEPLPLSQQPLFGILGEGEGEEEEEEEEEEEWENGMYVCMYVCMYTHEQAHAQSTHACGICFHLSII